MGKKINTSAMDELMGGLISAPVEEQESLQGVSSPEVKSKESKRGRKKSENTERICTIVNSELISKVRAIASKEGLNISSILNVGMELAIKNYESKHGPVRVHQSKKGDVNNVFDI